MSNSIQPKTVLEWAMYYKNCGFSVIPLRPKSKLPLFSWKEFQNRHATDAELIGWFGTGDNNIGIVTGPISGIAVVDADSAEAVAYCEENGLSETPCVVTSKGRHYYCANVPGTKNFQKRSDLPGIDLRGEGGYVVAPPSIHESGVRYTWKELEK